MKNSNRLLWIGISVSILLYISAIAFKLEVFEGFVNLMILVEDYEFDEVFFPIVILSVFLIFYAIQIKSELEKEKGKIYITTLTTTYQILKNFISQIEELKTEAKQNPQVDTLLIANLEKSIQEALDVLESLKNLKKLEVEEIKKIAGIKTL